MHPGGLRAIGCMIAAVAAFALMDALLKLLAAHYPPMEVAMLRGAASLPFMLLPSRSRAAGTSFGRGAGTCTCCAARSAW